jgi:uncharacterized membrane protein
MFVHRSLTTVVIVLMVTALAGAALLWPRGQGPQMEPSLPFLDATVSAVARGQCTSVDEGALADCQLVEARLGSGGPSTITFTVPDTDFSAPHLRAGDRVVVFDAGPEAGEFQYGFVDFQRSGPLWWLVVLFGLVVIGVGRWKGVRALCGLVASLAVLVVFVLPALLRGTNAVAVAGVAVVIIAVLALYTAHGISTGTGVALLGTLVSLAVITVLGALFIEAAHLTGLAGEDAQFLQFTNTALNARGLLLAGLVIGALGVLDDVTVTQVSAVSELRAADPTLSGWVLYLRAERIGRDHIASTINTLVLAYAGASLPLLLLFVQQNQTVGQVLTGEVIATEVVRALVGSIGLVLSVPVTTALAAVVLTRHTRTRSSDSGSGPSTATGAPEPVDPWARFAPEDKPFA